MHEASVRNRISLAGFRATDVTGELVTFNGLTDGREHVAYVVGDPGASPLVRIHSECLTGDVLGSTRCDCGPQLDEAVERMVLDGGVLLYMRQEGRGIGLYNKVDAYRLQDADVDTFRANEMLGRGADERDYRPAAQMLAALGIRRIRLLTNNPDKENQLRALGIDIVRVEPTEVHRTSANERYLVAKARHGHRLEVGRDLQPSAVRGDLR
ncbi:GTP cyclohydrolase II [Actinomycetospora corticicola]|uniref:GTP cyclohydrolase II n=1 Tax=Actinomycetospora corticicola TaxID=663602 RepID=A0A7Y9DS59_9PSEU|nr:GTP cyclohydrolase II [Actinomycetospora corticicola]NYD34505.1 GTP cyclohydrolase II [Actinomycetospora corticicola]